MGQKNQYQLIKEKLQEYNKPFIDKFLVEKLLDKFAPRYQIKMLTWRWLLWVIIKWKLYLNLCYRWYVSDYAILGKYMEWKLYMIWWQFIYNQYGFTTQLSDRITVYNTDYRWYKKIWKSYFVFKRARPSFFRWKEKKQSQNIKYYRMTKERALVQLIIEKKWKLEFKNDIYYKYKNTINDKAFYSMAKHHLNKNKYVLVDETIKWLKK